METRYPDFRVDDLLAMAAQATGLDDFGPDTFRPGLERLVAAINELGFTELGLLRARNSLLGNLVARMGVWDHRQRHPEVAAEEIRMPLFVLGLPRTGTTLLFGLLAQDPDHRVPMLWETAMPCPPPEMATYDIDPRIDLVTRLLGRQGWGHQLHAGPGPGPCPRPHPGQRGLSRSDRHHHRQAQRR